MSDFIFDRIKAIDTDTHVTEPPDLWTSRIASKWGDKIPHTRIIDGTEQWILGDQVYWGPGFFSMAGFDGSIPEGPPTFADCPAYAHDARARLKVMDEEGIYAGVMYPNAAGFGSAGFLKLGEPELMLDCVKAYNDFIVEEWASVAPNRLLAVSALPFWDIDAAVKEIQRCAAMDHRAILMCASPDDYEFPALPDPHWEPIWAATQEAGLSISFHIGGGLGSNIFVRPSLKERAYMARFGSLCFLQNATCIADLIFGGVCHRFPDLKFASVESGVGWLVSVVEGFDWQFTNAQVRRDCPELNLLPSEYFKRQIYGCFWYETSGIAEALKAYPDNMMFETDFPHPTCQYPTPANDMAGHPSAYAERALKDVPEDVLKKVLWSNAADLYGVKEVA